MDQNQRFVFGSTVPLTPKKWYNEKMAKLSKKQPENAEQKTAQKSLSKTRI